MRLFEELEKAMPFLSAQFSEKELLCFSRCDYRNLNSYYEKHTPWICTNLLKRDSELYQSFLRGGIHVQTDMAIILLQTLHLILRT